MSKMTTAGHNTLVHALNNIHNGESEGFTLGLTDGWIPDKGIAIGGGDLIPEKRIRLSEHRSWGDLLCAVMGYAHDILERDWSLIGGWVDRGYLVLDAVVLVPEDSPEVAGIIARRTNEDAVYVLSTGETIATNDLP